MPKIIDWRIRTTAWPVADVHFFHRLHVSVAQALLIEVVQVNARDGICPSGGDTYAEVKH